MGEIFWHHMHKRKLGVGGGGTRATPARGLCNCSLLRGAVEGFLSPQLSISFICNYQVKNIYNLFFTTSSIIFQLHDLLKKKKAHMRLNLSLQIPLSQLIILPISLHTYIQTNIYIGFPSELFKLLSSSSLSTQRNYHRHG